MLIPNKFNGYRFDGTRQAHISVGGGGGGGSQPAPAPSSQRVEQTTIPDYARPYVETMLGKTAALTDINQNPYQPYDEQRIAGFTPMQAQGFENVANQQVAGQVGEASNLASQVGQTAMGAFNQGQQLGQAAQGYGGLGADIGQQGQQLGVSGGGAYGQMGAGFGAAGVGLGQQAASLAPQANMFGQQGANFGAAGANLAPAAQNYGQTASNIGMGGLGYGNAGFGYGQRGVEAAEQGFGAGQRFEGMATDPRSQQAFMSPYMQNVVDYQKDQAIRDYGIASQGRNAQAVRSGAFGGSRQAVYEGEANRALMNQLAGIQATGTQKAFEDAQKQMQFGSQLGIQGLQAGYQGLQAGMQGADTGIRGLGTAIQGQQAGLQGLGQAGQLYGLGIQGAQAGLQGLQGAQDAYRTGLQGTAQGIQGAQTGLAGVDRQLAGTAQGLQGAQVGLQGVQGATAAGQYGLAGLGQAGQSAQLLGQLGANQFAQERDITNDMMRAGAVQQGQQQQGLDVAYQDFLKSQNYPYQQLAFQSDQLRGLPLSQSAANVYTAAPNVASQLGGLGTTAMGIYGMSGGFKANGGMVGKGYANGGLMAAKAYKDGGNISSLNVEQLTKMLENPRLDPMERAEIEQRIMLLTRMQSNPEAAGIMAPRQQVAGIDSIPTGDMVPEQMAGGGIVAFKEGGDTYQKFLEDQVRKSIENQMSGNAFAKSEAEKARLEQAIAARQERAPYEALAMAGLGTMSGTSQYGLTNHGLGATEGLKSYSRAKAADTADRQKMLEQQVLADKAEDARKSGLTGQMQSTLGQIYNKQATLEAAAARRAEAGSSKDERNLLRAAALIGSDPTIKSLQKQLENSGYQPGSPEYNYFEQRIAERQNQIYKTVGVTVPEVTPSNIAFPKPEEKPGLFDRIFGGDKKPAPSQNKVIPFNQLPAKG